MMQIVKRVLPVLFAALMLADSARAHTIDFDDLALGGFPGDTLVVDVDGVNVTFSGDGLATWSLDQVVFPGSGVQLVAGGFYGPITVEIEPGYSFDSISIINHLSSDFPRGTEPNITLPPHSEVDVITGRAFDQDGLLVDSFTSDMRLASLTGTGIVILTFPIGIGSAIYLEEYATDNWTTRLIQVTVRNLAGVPSIVYGVFA